MTRECCFQTSVQSLNIFIFAKVLYVPNNYPWELINSCHAWPSPTTKCSQSASYWQQSGPSLFSSEALTVACCVYGNMILKMKKKIEIAHKTTDKESTVLGTKKCVKYKLTTFNRDLQKKSHLNGKNQKKGTK